MKRFLFLTMALVLAFSALTMATETRVGTMGDNNMILLDEANIFMFPSRIADWPNLAVGEFGSNDFSSFGVHWKLGNKEKPWYLATYFHNNTADLPSIWNSPSSYAYAPRYIPFSDVDFPSSNKRMDLVYGRKYNDMVIGMNLGLVHSSQRAEADDDKDEAAMGMYSVTFGLTAKEGLLDIAVGYETLSFTNKGTAVDSSAFDISKGEGNHRLHFTGRSFYQVNDKYTLVPHISISSAKFESEYNEHDGTAVNLMQTDKYTHKVVDLGVGVQYTPARNVLAVLDFGLAYDKLDGEFTVEGAGTTEVTAKVVSFPYFKLGFDADVFKWMDVRFGATSYWNSSTLEDGGLSREDLGKGPDNNTYLGFGFHWGRLHIDTHTDPNMFIRGFDFINGASHGSDMNFKLSVVYEMM